MSGKNLTFKLVMDADNKGFVSTAKNSESVMKAVFDSIKSESDKLKQVSLEASSEIGNLVPSETKQKVAQLVTELTSASKALEAIGGDADLSADNLKQMGDYGQKALSSLQEDLKQAKLHLNYLSATNATPADIQNAQKEVKELEVGVKQVKTSFEAYKGSADIAINSIVELADEAQKSSNALSNIIPKGTNELADKLTQSLTAATGIIKDAGDNAKSTAGNFTDFGNKSHKALDQLKSDLVLARQNLESFSKTNATPADIEKAKAQVDQLEKEVQQADQAFNNFHAEVGKANSELKETDSAAQTAQKGLDTAKFAVNALAGAMATLGIGLGVRELAEAADSYTNLSTRIHIATKDGGDFTSAMAGVHQVALMTNSSLTATGDLFTRLNAVGKDMGMTQQQALDLTKTVTQAIQIGGGSAQASEAAVQQFIQAMQGGVLRGEEFNSIMENGYGVAEALAKGLGVTTGELRKMAENGELSAERVVKAIQSQASEVQKTYDQFPVTISNALQKIATSWQILIGEMDQANGSSATVANALLVVADNLEILKLFFDDVAEGVGYFTSRFENIDPSVLDVLRETLTQVYETVKQNIKYIVEFGDTAWSAFTSALDAVSPFFNVLLGGGENVSGLTTLLNVLRMAMAGVSDITFGLNIGFKVLLSSIQFLAGGIYSLAAATLRYVPFMGDLADEAEKSSDRMFAQAEKNMQGAIKLSSEHKWAVVETYKEIQKTEEQKNTESVASSKAKLDQLLADQQTEVNGRKITESEKQSAVQTYAEAAIKANGGVMDGVMQADLLTKGYIVTIDEAGKVSVLAGESAEKAAENAKAKEEALKLAKENVKKADEEYLAYQKQAAIERVILEKQIEDAKRTGDLNALSSAQDSLSGINAKEAELAKNRELRISELNKVTSGSGQVAESAYSRASAAANQFGVDLDVSLNRVSKSFAASGTQLTELKGKLNEAGVTGQNAATVLYQSWEAWLNKAKSQAEIDAANAKLVEFEKQGVFSTKQVELGIQAIRRANAALPDELDETGKAFDRLGIKTKDQLKLAAQSAIADFNTIQKSGQATQEGLQKAYEETIRLAYASGDAGVIAAANAKASSLGLRVQIDETGKASVKAMDEWTKSNDRVRDSAYGIGDGYRNAGSIAREEAKSTEQAWSDAVDAASAQFDAEMKRQGQSLSKGIYNYDSYSKADVVSQLKSKGYSDKEADKLAGSIWSKAMEADRDAKAEGMGKGGNPALNRLIEQEFNNAASKGLTTQHGTNKINDLLRQMSSNNLVSTGSTSKAPAVDVNSLAPQVSTPVPSTTENVTTKNSRIELVSGNKTATLTGSQQDVDTMEEIMREFEMLKRSS